MNKPDFIAKVAEKTGLTKKDTESVINAALEAISDALAEGDRVQFVGFGTFEARNRAAHTVHNPLTNETVEMPEKRVPAFKAGLALKTKVAVK